LRSTHLLGALPAQGHTEGQTQGRQSVAARQVAKLPGCGGRASRGEGVGIPDATCTDGEATLQMSALRQGRQGLDPEQIHEVASYGWQAVRAEGVRILMLRVSKYPTPPVQTSTQSSCTKYNKDVATSALGR